jgi:hypothetical protein
VIKDKLEEAPSFYPTIQSQVPFPVEQLPQFVIESWEPGVFQTGPVALDDYNPGAAPIGAPDAEDEEWQEKFQSLS